MLAVPDRCPGRAGPARAGRGRRDAGRDRAAARSTWPSAWPRPDDERRPGRAARTVIASADLFEPARPRRQRAAGSGADRGGGRPGDPAAARSRCCDPAERAQMLRDWNDTAAARPAGTLPELFEAQVARTPDAVAVVVRGHAWSATRSWMPGGPAGRGYWPRPGPGRRRWSRWSGRGPRTWSPPARRDEGRAAYLPVDPGYPAERIAFMLADARPAVIGHRRPGLGRTLPDVPGGAGAGRRERARRPAAGRSVR